MARVRKLARVYLRGKKDESIAFTFYRKVYNRLGIINQESAETCVEPQLK